MVWILSMFCHPVTTRRVYVIRRKDSANSLFLLDFVRHFIICCFCAAKEEHRVMMSTYNKDDMSLKASTWYMIHWYMNQNHHTISSQRLWHSLRSLWKEDFPSTGTVAELCDRPNANCLMATYYLTKSPNWFLKRSTHSILEIFTSMKSAQITPFWKYLYFLIIFYGLKFPHSTNMLFWE